MLEAVPREHNLQLYMRYAGIFVLRTSKERKAFFRRRHTTLISFAGMAELADALDSGSSEVTFVQVQVLLPAPTENGMQKYTVFCFHHSLFTLT